ncbi:type II toxin-antitoxin system ParD family antitoxin [Rhizobium sp. H4]|uniref:type II toxin-antitoxin system ParD family antitoxin n=1 Tax=Rhizobium sp. H4 TaxID=2035449 RepID=UPI000D0F4CE4|nr:type II toxin-antitoxin system ParD family antitoxin [Rhizobium sp. H4]
MANSVSLEQQVGNYVDQDVDPGQEKRLEALDLAIDQGIADADAGRIKPIGDIASRLAAKYGVRS